MKFSLFKGRLGQNGGRMLESQAHCFLKSNYYIFFTEMSHIDDIFGVLVWVDYAVQVISVLQKCEIDRHFPSTTLPNTHRF